MATLPLAPPPLPLRLDEEGAVRIGPTRVTLDTLVASYRDRNSAEEIVEQYPALSLADVHAAIAYYLTHQAEVDAYLQQRQREAADTRREVERFSDQRGIRERLLARQAAKKSGT
jgi:uncharacterized protein (DUF433 family)